MRHFWVEIEKAFASKAFSFPVSTFSISLSSHVFPFVVKINRIMLNFSQDDRETKKSLRRAAAEMTYIWKSFLSVKLFTLGQKSNFCPKKPPRFLMKTTCKVVWIFAPKIILKKWNIWIFALNLQTFFYFCSKLEFMDNKLILDPVCLQFSKGISANKARKVEFFRAH